MALNLRQKDKQKHVAASFVINTAVYLAARTCRVSKTSAYALAVVATLLIGMAKEANDPMFDMEDVGANAIGIAGTLPIVLISF